MREHPRVPVHADRGPCSRPIPSGEHVSFFNWHFGGYDRKQCDAGRQNYIPCNLGEIPDYYRRFIDPPDVMVVKTCPIDADGYFNFGPANLWHRAVASRAKVVIVEVDPALPYVHGIDNGLHASEVDYVIDGDGAAAARAAERGTDRRRSCRGAADRGGDRRRRVPADRHRRDAERRVLAADGERRARPRRPHRDAHRRDHRPLPGRCRDRRGEDVPSRQDRVHLRVSARSRRTTRSTTTPTSRANRST